MLRPIGDWNTMLLFASALDEQFQQARRTALAKIGLYMEGRAKKHMRDQDLGWVALKPSTIAAKIRLGQSTNTLIATSTYFQKITHNVQNDRVTAGVSRKAVNEEGVPIADIARAHEFGTMDIPKRPLWAPVLKEGINWANSTKVLEKELIKKLAKFRVL